MPELTFNLYTKYSSVTEEWVKSQHQTFLGNYPSGRATKDEVIVRLKDVVRERFPKLNPDILAENIYIGKVL